VSLARHGTGTERLESELDGPVFRLDADVAAPGRILAAFEAAPRGVLVGTQMVAKGHDFPDVDLGVVLDADATLRFPDFRAEERTFALVTQLAGRAGRGEAGGRVLVQTLAPDAPSIRLAAHHDADGFLAGELERRRALRYPPFSTLIRVVCSSQAHGAALVAATAVRERLDDALGPAPLFRLRGRERAQVVVKAVHRARAVGAVGAAVTAVAADRAHRHASFSVDVDPQ
jgi:primosomal protein N' (replication factor Y)